MTKNEIARDVNITANTTRIVSFSSKYNFEVGEIYDNRGKAESWSLGGKFDIETSRKYVYLLKCQNVPCHKVDYTNVSECETLGASDCKSEDEVLVPAETKMVITSAARDGDFEEMGYYEVEMELVN